MNMRFKNSFGFKALLAGVVLLAAPLEATTLAKLMKMPAFMNLVVTIARVNQAMRSAAENPMDAHRRIAVQKAIAAMPLAIGGLAGEFQAGRLHNGDLKTVQALLGGFIAVNAADNYKKFIQQPSPALIPQVGSGLPSSLMNAPSESGSGGSMAIVANESRSKGANFAQSTADPYAQAPDLAPGSQYYSRSLASVPETIRSSGSGADFAPRVKNSAAKSSNVAEDLKMAEKSAAYRLQSKPRYWKFGSLLHHAESLLLHSAHAEEEGQQENCGDCKKGGGAGGGGGGGGGGADAASILFGMAAIMAAAVPAITASMQAEADKEMARTQAEAQKYMTDKTVQNSEALANLSAQTSLQTASMQAQAAQANNQGVTERLSMQLASLEKARMDAAAQEAQRLELENGLNERRIALAERQAEQNVQLARATISAQLTQAGLSQGTVSTNSGTSVEGADVGGGIGNNTFADSLASAPPRQPSAGAGLSAGSLGIRGALSPSESSLGNEFFSPPVSAAPTRLLRSLKSPASGRALAAPQIKAADGLASRTLLAAKAGAKDGDLSSFVRSNKPLVASTGGFAEYRNSLSPRTGAAPSQSARGIASSGLGHGAYRAP